MSRRRSGAIVETHEEWAKRMNIVTIISNPYEPVMPPFIAEPPKPPPNKQVARRCGKCGLPILGTIGDLRKHMKDCQGPDPKDLESRRG